MVRRAFQLSESDRGFLETAYPEWEAIIEGQSKWLLLEPFGVPAGFNHRFVAVALLIDPMYPDAQVDMAYFRPDLARSDGKGINALSAHQLNGQTWQRWSRHRQSGVWRPGVDNIETHLLYVESFLELELRK
jgi:hypothetical protein